MLFRATAIDRTKMKTIILNEWLKFLASTVSSFYERLVTSIMHKLSFKEMIESIYESF